VVWLFRPGRYAEKFVDRLNTAVVVALNDPTVHQRLADIGQSFFAGDELTPETLRAYQRAAIEKWWPIIKEAGIKAGQ
jgi:tripartite-type tricarboxylate transporter receptor subunit TctC